MGKDGISRRAVLKGLGAGVSALAAPPLAQPARAAAGETQAADTRTGELGAGGAGRFALENGFLRLAGVGGTLTELSVDAGGRGSYEPATLRSAGLGAVDLSSTEAAAAASWTAGPGFVQVASIPVPVAREQLQQRRADAAAPPLAGAHRYGQSFTITADLVHRVAIQVAAYDLRPSGFTLALHAGDPERGLRRIASKHYRSVTANGWVSLEFPPQPGGRYYVEMSEPLGIPGWWYRYLPAGPTSGLAPGAAGSPPLTGLQAVRAPAGEVFRPERVVVEVGGLAFVDRVRRPGWAMAFEASGVALGALATWRFALDGPRLTSTYALSAGDGQPFHDPGLRLVLPWQADGYGLDYDDGVLFSRIVADNGRYLPMQQLKRRQAWGLDLGTRSWLHFTGCGPYDLRLSAEGLRISGEMTPDAMTLRVAGSPGTFSEPFSRALQVEVLAHSDWLPSTYPVFQTFDVVRGEQLSRFFYERAYSFPFGETASDWKDWQGRILDWSATAGRDGERDSLLAIGQQPDGYVWSWQDSPGWPFPDPEIYDTRHFSTNAMYILGACRYYAWTGDEQFLATMLPRVRSAMGFTLRELDGVSGLLTIGSPDHSGEPQALGSNYWDISCFGYRDAYANAYFHAALGALAELEAHLGNHPRASELRGVQALCRRRYNELFWDDDAGRYVQAVDREGVRHDYGSTSVNLEAAALGLPSPSQATRIFGWLDEGHTELTEVVVAVPEPGAPAEPSAALVPEDTAAAAARGRLVPGATLGQSFIADQPFAQVAARVDGPMAASFTVSLRAGGPEGTVVAAKTLPRWWNATASAVLPVDRQPAGRYCLELSGASATCTWLSGFRYQQGTAFANGAPVSGARSLTVISPHRRGPADIYRRWRFAPRATTRRNDFWYPFVWLGQLVPWEQQLQDGGTALYLSGFDVIARARYSSADGAWQRLCAVLDRWAEPDHLCGGAPLFRDEPPQSELPGAVGVDHPFPESALAPVSFLNAFLGIEATPGALTIRPNLPRALPSAGVRNLVWRGTSLDVDVTTERLTVSSGAQRVERSYRAGQTLQLRRGSGWLAFD